MYGPAVLATGGCAADFTEDSLLKKHRPGYHNLPTTNGDRCTGDGHKVCRPSSSRRGALADNSIWLYRARLCRPTTPMGDVVTCSRRSFNT
ncbi:hypothetical protein FIBSPDRAFT_876207 [Athelia psychrophila]|uniref:Uncharacterized protein n=1 Tax=Athelia psychrophila TaxID=1759441 RepID=A0A167X2R7_9AGAM|nr:hypothetical protein FIBSPDRAFT_876207 [Fibularhizoctonia sp. CBS 109695]